MSQAFLSEGSKGVVSGEHWRRADLHCHSIASTEADEALLNALECPECYSSPAAVYAQARSRGMDFVTITDHDCLDGILSLRGRDLIVGEELTCYFPEDHCKMHVLVWGITKADHVELQARGQDIYAVAEYLEAHRIAHSVAHPLYRQNDRLGRWHLERLLLLFKGFECLNGAHSMLHRDAFLPVVETLTELKLAEIADRHHMSPRWPEPWIKARTGGSDDHGLLNVGRTWTEFPPDVTTPEQALEAIRTARCGVGGEAGSSLKLAHNFLSVGIRHYTRAVATRESLVTKMLLGLVGDRPKPRKREFVKATIKRSLMAATRGLSRPFRSKWVGSGTQLLGELTWKSLRRRRTESSFIFDSLERGLPPLAQHEMVFSLLSGINRDITAGVFSKVRQELSRGELAGIFDALSTLAAQQAGLLPYYFALFHQNKERHLCAGITGVQKQLTPKTIKIGLFTDTFDEVNGVARFLRRLGSEAQRRTYSLSIATCHPAPTEHLSCRVNFVPVASLPMPHYPELSLSLPPILDILEWADRQQFDAIHISTPGPMGLMGWLVAKMLRIPVLATYHTDFPAFVQELTSDHRLTSATKSYMDWFYGNMAKVFSRSRAYTATLLQMGLANDTVKVLPPCTDPENYSPRRRDSTLFRRMGIAEPLRLLYVGRISAEKNLKLLVETFSRLCRERHDVALVVVGEGPYLPKLKRLLADTPTYCLGFKQGAELASIYASSDLFVFPSRTDTLGQVVIEAQASGLPVVVSDRGGPSEVMDDGVTGRVVVGVDPTVWCAAVDELLDDLPARSRMSRNAAARASRYTRSDVFDTFWTEHVKAAEQSTPQDVWCEPPAEAGRSPVAATSEGGNTVPTEVAP